MSKKKRKVRKSSTKITFEQSGQALTSQAGLVPVVKFLDRIGTDEILSGIEHERASNAKYQLDDAMIFSAVGVIGGARSIDGICSVCSDPVIMNAANWVTVCNPTTLSRIVKETGFQVNASIETAMHELRQAAWSHIAKKGNAKSLPDTRMVVDVDSTVKTVYGNQEGAEKGYNPTAKGKKSFHPQLAFCAETKEILQAWLRSGSAYTSNGITDFYGQLRAGIDRSMRLVMRCDSGYFKGSFFDDCEANRDGYLVKVKMKNLNKLMAAQKWSEVPRGEGVEESSKMPDREEVWEQSTFEYKCAGWGKERKFIAVRREKEKTEDDAPMLLEVKEYDYFCYVTTEAYTPWEAHKEYGKRATCETWIEESKNQMALGHIKTNDFWGNSVLFQACVLGYNTIRWMALASGDKRLRQMEPATIRCFFIRIAGKLLTGSRQNRILTPRHILYPEHWLRWLAAADIAVA